MRRRNFSASLTLFAILPSSVFAETGDETKFDLIIIGIGAAGLSTAVSAAQNGVKNILLIDKAAFVGGHSALSGGSVNAVVPELQMKQGIKDSPEFWQRQIMETGEFQSDPVLVNTLVNNAQSTLHWLREIGISFDDQVFEAWRKVPACAFRRPKTKRHDLCSDHEPQSPFSKCESETQNRGGELVRERRAGYGCEG